MMRAVVTSRVGHDGVLHLDVPLGVDDADKDVTITIESNAKPAMTQEEWRAFIDRTAGSWQGEFERPPQGD